MGRIAWYFLFLAVLAEPPAESPSTINISHFWGSLASQLASFPFESNENLDLDKRFVFTFGNVTLDFDQVIELTEDYEISEEDIQDSIEFLKSKSIIKYENFLGDNHPQMIKLTYYGIVKYSENYLENISDVIKDIVSIILNMGRQASEKDFEEVPAPMMIVEAIVEYFSKLGYFKFKKYFDGFMIYLINGNGKRQLKKYLD